MTITVSMPQLGLTMTEATVSEWFKKPGDSVQKDEPLLSVSTDKVDMDIEATGNGILLEIVVGQGQTVPVGTPLAYIGVPGEASTSPSTANVSSAPSSSPSSSVAEASNNQAIDIPVTERDIGTGSLRASPRARRRARELGIDISTIKGSGPDGRIVEKDLSNLAAGRPTAAIVSPDAKRRQIIADRMIESIRTIPSFSISLEVNAEKLVSLYQSLSETIGQHAGSKLTYTDLLLRALALSLAESPAMNAVWDDGVVRQVDQVNLGLAVATERGVIAPILTNAARLSLAQMVTRRAALVERARQSRLNFTDMEGGVGTLSSLGMYRIDRFEGLISPGQTFLLAAGKLRNRPWIEDGALAVKPTVILTLSVDHRVADGATAAVLLEQIAEIIENPYRLFWDEREP